MERQPKFSKAEGIFKRIIQIGSLLGAMGLSPQILEGQNTPETKALRAKTEQVIIGQIEDKELGMSGTIGISTKMKRFEEGGKVITVGYDSQQKAKWVMTSQGDSIVFVDRNLDGDPDRIVIDRGHKGKVGLAFDELSALQDIDGMAKNVATVASLDPQNKTVIDVGSTVKLVSFKTGEAAEGSLEETKLIVDNFQVRFGSGLKDIEKAVMLAKSKK
jgi:co-chaperonin GroES (HSP10)